MPDGPSQLPILLTFAGVAGEPPTGEPLTGEPPAPAAPTTMPADAGAALRAFFEAHPTVEFVQFEIALNENGDDLEFAGGTLHGADGAPLRESREARQAGDAFRRLLRGDPHLTELPVRLAVAYEGVEHTFRIMRDATGAPRPPGEPTDADARAAARERARLTARDAQFDQRDVLPDDDHAA